MDIDLASRFDRMQAQLDRIEALVDKDYALALRLFPPLVGVVGTGNEFTAAEALEYPAVQVVTAGMSPAALGLFFGRMAGRSVAGLRVQCVRQIAGKTNIWDVRADPSAHPAM